jgi:tRNA(Ile)-lysidine synthase
LPEIQAQLVASHDSTHPGETFARDALPPVLTVRSRLPGDRLVPFGSRTPKKLQDLLVDARLPAEQRDALPILVAEGTIIWVPGLRRAEFGRTSPGQETVHIALRPLPSR